MNYIFLLILFISPVKKDFDDKIEKGIPRITINGISESGEKIEIYIVDYYDEAKIKLIAKNKVYEYHSDPNSDEGYCDTIIDMEKGVFALMIRDSNTKAICRIRSIPDTVRLLEKGQDVSNYKLKIKFDNYDIKGDFENVKRITFDCTLERFL